MKILRYAIYVVLFLLVFVGVFALVVVFTDSWATQFPEEMEVEVNTNKAKRPKAAPTDTLRVMTYNVKFGGARIDFFFDCFGERVHMKESEVNANLKALAEKIEQYDPHILLLQEVDFEAKRSADINQYHRLMKLADMPYGVYASQWNVAYIPTEGLGHVNSGNVILSRFPLENAKRYQLDQMEEQDAVTRFFYLRRNILRAEAVIAPGKRVAIYNTHLSAYSKDGTRKKQLAELENLLKKETLPFIAGGDFNTLPPGTKKVKGFDDSVCEDDDFVMDDYTKELDYLRPFYDNYNEAIPLADYKADEAKYYSHTVSGLGWRKGELENFDGKRSFWNRRLDYLFSNQPWIGGTVHQDTTTGMATMPLSDHAPVTGEVILGKNQD